MVDNIHISERMQLHAKLLRYRDQQALAFMQRGESEALMIVVQLWCASADHQLRVALSVDDIDETVIYEGFKDLDDGTLAQMMDVCGVPAILDQMAE